MPGGEGSTGSAGNPAANISTEPIRN